jgi:hypothetical protein
LGVVATLGGDPEQGTVYQAETLSILCDLGMSMWIALELCTYALDIFLHAGRNQILATMLEEGMSIARRHEINWFVGSTLVRQAMLALVAAQPHNAMALAEESLPWLERIERLDDLGEARWVCAMAACMDDDLGLARRQARLGHEIVQATGHYDLRCTGMVVDAMLAQAEGRTDGAGEACAAAQREPFVASSHYFAALFRMMSDGQLRTQKNEPLALAKTVNLP